LQDRALGLFARSLPPGGFLGLGAKESLHFSAHSHLFSEFSPRDKVYRRNAIAYDTPHTR